MNPELVALNEACQIVRRAQLAVCDMASSKPYLTLCHAREYLTRQADELLRPIFSPTCIVCKNPLGKDDLLCDECSQLEKEAAR